MILYKHKILGLLNENNKDDAFNKWMHYAL
jgi:hypothetical protein